MRHAAAEAELDRLAALCGSLRLQGSRGDLAGRLLEPIASALGADSAACRLLRLRQTRPQIVDLTSIGTQASVADDYLDHFHRLDPFLDHLRLPPATPDGRSGADSSERLQRYYREFLQPNGLVRHMDFLISDHARRHVWLFNFHRPASAPDFSSLELARSRLIAACLQGQAGERTSVADGLTPRAALTPREQEIAIAVAQGLANKQIAAELAISPRTVENHLRKIYEKLHINTRTQLLSVLHRQVRDPDAELIQR